MSRPAILAFHPRAELGAQLARVLCLSGARVFPLHDLGMFPAELRRLDPEVVLLPYRSNSATLAPLLHLVREDAPLARVVLLAARADLALAGNVAGTVAAIEVEPELDTRTAVKVVDAACQSVSTEGTVLVVEDSTLILEMTVDVLHAKGYRALRAESAEEGIALARRAEPDLILMDIRLPGRSGVEALIELKADPATSAIPVVMLSANGNEITVGEALEQGAIDFLVKPFSPRLLVEKVAHVVAKRELLVHA